MLTVTDLTFSYPAEKPGQAPVQVLYGASLALPVGASVGLLGPNGSGKSTMLGAITNSIFGLTTGEVAVDPGAVGPIGFATQNPALYQHLSVRENLEHAARLTTGRWRVNDLVDDAVEEYQLAATVNVLARTLSGGQSRAAHLACSFIHKPSIRLLDEPTTALDFETRQLLVELVQGWRSRNIATLVTAHYPEDIEELCAELVVLVDGTTHALGPIDLHLRSLGTTASIQLEGNTVELAIESPSLDSLLRAAAGAGVSPETDLDLVRMSPPTLRDVLRNDPSLRSAATEVPT